MTKGDMSEPVKTQYGYHLIEVTDITPEQQLTYDQVKEKIKTILLSNKQEYTWEAWLTAKQAELGVAYRKGYAPASGINTEYELLPSTSTSGTTTTTKATSSDGT